MGSQQNLKESLKSQCHLTDLYRNQLQLTTYELQKSRGTIQHLRAILISFFNDFNIKSDQMSTILDFISKSCEDDTRIAILEESFKKSLSSAFSTSRSFPNASIMKLPKVLISLILEYLDTKELTIASYTCKDIYLLCQCEWLWKSLAHSRWAQPISDKHNYLKRYSQEMSWYHTRPVVSTLLGHTGSVTCLNFVAGTNSFISGSDDCSLALWEIAEIRSQDNEIVKQHHIQTKTVSKKISFYGHGGPVWSCIDGRDSTIISGSYDKTLKIWNIFTGRCEFTIRGHNGWISSIDCDEEIIVSGSWDSTIKVWDRGTKQCISTISFNNDAVYCLQLQKPYAFVGLKSKVVEYWDLGNSTKLVGFLGHYKAINAVKVNGNLMFSGSSDTLVKVWDVRSGECVANLAGHASNVMGLDYDECSMKLATASYDKTIRIWDLRKNNANRAVLRGHSDPVFCIKLDDHRLISGSMDQSIKIWNFKCN